MAEFNIDTFDVEKFPLGSWDRKPTRKISATWANGERREVNLSVSHWKDRKAMVAIVSDAYIPDSDGERGFKVRVSSPMDSTLVRRIPCDRYSKKKMEEFFAACIADMDVLATVAGHAAMPTAPADR